MTLAYHPKAREDARLAFLHYAVIDESLAEDFASEVSEAVDYIRRNPQASRIRRNNVRRFNLSRFKLHYIAYMLWQEQIVVIAIGHANRRPYYWYRRPREYRENR